MYLDKKRFFTSFSKHLLIFPAMCRVELKKNTKLWCRKIRFSCLYQSIYILIKYLYDSEKSCLKHIVYKIQFMQIYYTNLNQSYANMTQWNVSVWLSKELFETYCLYDSIYGYTGIIHWTPPYVSITQLNVYMTQLYTSYLTQSYANNCSYRIQKLGHQ